MLPCRLSAFRVSSLRAEPTKTKPGGGSGRDPDRSSSLLSSEDDKYLVASHRLVARTSCLINLPLPQARFSWSSHERKPYQPTDTAKYPKHAYPPAELKAARPDATDELLYVRSSFVQKKRTSGLFLISSEQNSSLESRLIQHDDHTARAARDVFLGDCLHRRPQGTYRHT